MAWSRDLTSVRPLVGSVTDHGGWSRDRTLDDVRGIFHLAALVRHTRRGAADIYRTNVDGALDMVRVAAQQKCRMVFVSTSGTVGCFRRPNQTADELAPHCVGKVRRWPYYHSKIIAEQQAQHLAEELGVDLVIVRPPVLLGPGDHRFRSTAHLVWYLRGKLAFVIRGGVHFTDVRDVARALVRVMDRPQTQRVYHLPGTECTVQDFFALAERVSGVPAPKLVVPFRLAWCLATIGSGLRLDLLPDPVVVEMASHYWGMSSRYSVQELGYECRPGEVTMKDTIEWLRQNHDDLRRGVGAP